MDYPEPREIDVDTEDSHWLEYDRDIKITLHHSGNHGTTLKISEAEAFSLYRKLGAEIDRRHPADGWKTVFECPHHDHCDGGCGHVYYADKGETA